MPDALFPFSSFTDVDAVYDSDSLSQVFQTARPLKAVVRQTSKTMEHPAETGIIIGDHRIINQTEIEMPMVINAVDYDQAYSEIQNLFLNGTLLLVQTRLSVYSNMIIVNLPHEETAEMFDAVTLVLYLKEVLFEPSPSTFDPTDDTNSGTVQTGQQKPIDSPTAVASGPVEITNPNMFNTPQGTQPVTSGGVTITNPQQLEVAARGASGVW